MTANKIANIVLISVLISASSIASAAPLSSHLGYAHDKSNASPSATPKAPQNVIYKIEVKKHPAAGGSQENSDEMLSYLGKNMKEAKSAK